MTHTVVVHPPAESAVLRNANWLRRNYSSRSADRWNDGIVAALAGLATNPDRCPEADEASDLGLALRQLLHGRRPHVFRILFTIDGNTVNIHHIRHAAQDRLTADAL
ncbi:type II toxin-antitoxin system RelE/ParE family toxin [Urbifossiella limnaea]|uniref:Plasmid stabilization system protein n=1 Tax=Urbifossiella limnaea TaxID=2528023 RepID=A0A517XP23_9BACT|nr:type II toxin-antitoxin system RelE/ParE family toxin [Urbifossiella limnaea]QDU19260.1 Plasmid stabilization system protein [Urbifossiella limnaea]